LPEVLVTIPAYNEQQSIGRVVREIKKVLTGIDHKVMVVSDGSTDNTELEAEMAGAKVFAKEHSGLADTFRREMTEACNLQPKIIVHTDADGQYDPEDIPRLIREVRYGNDLVLGSRLKGTIEKMPRTKQSINIIATFILRTWLRADITDATTGMRAFTPRVARLIMQSDYTYTIEQLIRAKRAGLKIISVPIKFRPRSDGNSRLMRNPLHYLWNTALNLRKMTR